MDKRKPRASKIDELALAKSAAWAWYERGSGTDGRLIREFDGWRTKVDPKPSRYMLEALKNAQEITKCPSSISSPTSVKSTSCASISLLDKYEIERISRQLDDYMQSSYAKYHGGDNVGQEAVAGRKSKLIDQKKVPKGFLLRHGIVLCGSSSTGEVVESAGFEGGPLKRQQRPVKGNRVAVVDMVVCRPRRSIRS